MVSLDLDYIETQLSAPHADRDLLLEIITNAEDIPYMVKGFAAMTINTLPQSEIDRYRDIALGALEFMKSNDSDGLINYLHDNDIPDIILNVIRAYADKY